VKLKELRIGSGATIIISGSLLGIANINSKDIAGIYRIDSKLRVPMAYGKGEEEKNRGRFKGPAGKTKNPISSEPGKCVTADTLLPVIRRDVVAQFIGQNDSGAAPDRGWSSRREPAPKSLINQATTEGDVVAQFIGQDSLVLPDKSGNYNIMMLPIVDVQAGDYVLSLNEQTQRIEPHRINALLDMGIKPVYRLTTQSGRSIKTTINHPYLIRLEGWRAGKLEGVEKFQPPSNVQLSSQNSPNNYTQWLRVKDLEAGDEIGVPKLGRLDKFFYGNSSSFENGIKGSGFNGFGTMQRNNASTSQICFVPHNYMRALLTFNKKSVPFKDTDNFLTRDTRQFSHTETSTSLNSTSTSDSGIGKSSSLRDQIYNSIASLILVIASSIVSPCEAHPESAGTWTEYPPSDSGSIITLNRFNISTLPISKNTMSFSESQAKSVADSDIFWDRIASIEYAGYEHVYDIEVEGTHNFIGNNIFAHNTAISEPPAATPSTRSTTVSWSTRKNEPVPISFNFNYLETGRKPPKIELNTWKAFYLFLKEARLLGSGWEAKGRGVEKAFKKAEQIEIKDKQEYGRLMQYLREPKKAVLFDLDGTATKTVTNPKTGQSEIPKGLRLTHKQIVKRFAILANSGIIVVPVTNRRQQKTMAYVEQILVNCKSKRKGLIVEAYWNSGTNGMDAVSGQEFENFRIQFPQQQQDEIIVKLGAYAEYAEKLEGKINISVPQGADRSKVSDGIKKILVELGYLKSEENFILLQNSYTLLKVIDAGENIITIIPAEADKVRARENIKSRHKLKDDEILVLVDQPQKGAADERLAYEGGIAVGEENAVNPNLISVKKAIGLEGPKAALWVLEHTNFIPQRTIRRSFSATNL